MRLPKLRISTIVFLVLVAAVILLANIPGQIVWGPNMDDNGQYGPEFAMRWNIQPWLALHVSFVRLRSRLAILATSRKRSLKKSFVGVGGDWQPTLSSGYWPVHRGRRSIRALATPPRSSSVATVRYLCYLHVGRMRVGVLGDQAKERNRQEQVVERLRALTCSHLTMPTVGRLHGRRGPHMAEGLARRSPVSVCDRVIGVKSLEMDSRGCPNCPT